MSHRSQIDWTSRQSTHLSTGRLALLASLCWLMGATGCGLSAEEPEEQAPTTETPKADTGTPEKKEFAAPLLDAVPATVCTPQVALQGKTVAGARVLVQGGSSAAGASVESHPTTGRFCIEVPLRLLAVNTLEVQAYDPDLGYSQVVIKKVTQSGCQDDVSNEETTQEEPSQNVALGLQPRASASPAEGNDAALTDGDLAKGAKYVDGGWYGDASVWVTFKLDKLTSLKEMVIRWRDSLGAGTAYGVKYRVLTSAMPDPGDPSIKNGLWTEVFAQTQGDGGEDTVYLKNTEALHVAIWLELDNALNLGEEFAINEVEIWSTPTKTTTSPTTKPNTCPAQ